MPDQERSVLHILPHPSGGGETYVNKLAGMEGYRFEKAFIATSPTPSPSVLVGGARVQLSSLRCDLLHVQGEVAAALCQPTLALRPSVVSIQGLHLVRRLGGWRRTAAVANLRLIVRAASMTICVGEAEFEDVKALVGESERLVLVRNGVEALPPFTAQERAASRDELMLPTAATVGLYLAALDPHKEPLVVARAALDAAASGAPLVLFFAGDGPLRGDLEALAGDDSVLRVAGYQSDVRRVLAASDFFVLPSRREGLSFSLLEAMSAGLPPVVSDAPGNPQAVGDAGIVVPEGNIDGFREAFERLALDEAERKGLGERARRRVAERFSSDEMLRRTRDIYDEVLGHVP